MADLPCYDSRPMPSGRDPLRWLPKTKAGFVEPMDCLPVAQLTKGLEAGPAHEAQITTPHFRVCPAGWLGRFPPFRCKF